MSRCGPSYRRSVEEERGGATTTRGGGTGVYGGDIPPVWFEVGFDAKRNCVLELAATGGKGECNAESESCFLGILDGFHDVMEIKLCSIPQPLIGTKYDY